MDANVCHGKPSISGMRWPVEVIYDMMLSGMTYEEILMNHPELKHADLMSCLAYTRLLASGHKIILDHPVLQKV